MNEVLSRLRTGTALEESAQKVQGKIGGCECKRSFKTGRPCLLAQSKIAGPAFKSQLEANLLGGDKTLRKSALKAGFAEAFLAITIPSPAPPAGSSCGGRCHQHTSSEGREGGAGAGAGAINNTALPQGEVEAASSGTGASHHRVNIPERPGTARAFGSGA